MEDNKKQVVKAFKVYIVAGHLAWLIISPLLLFIGGGGWLVNRLALPSWLMILFIFAGLIMMVSGVWAYLRKLLQTFGYTKAALKKTTTKIDSRDYDYHD